MPRQGSSLLRKPIAWASSSIGEAGPPQRQGARVAISDGDSRGERLGQYGGLFAGRQVRDESSQRPDARARQDRLPGVVRLGGQPQRRRVLRGRLRAWAGVLGQRELAPQLTPSAATGAREVTQGRLVPLMMGSAQALSAYLRVFTAAAGGGGNPPERA